MMAPVRGIIVFIIMVKLFNSRGLDGIMMGGLLAICLQIVIRIELKFQKFWKKKTGKTIGTKLLDVEEVISGDLIGNFCKLDMGNRYVRFYVLDGQKLWTDDDKYWVYRMKVRDLEGGEISCIDIYWEKYSSVTEYRVRYKFMNHKQGSRKSSDSGFGNYYFEKDMSDLRAMNADFVLCEYMGDYTCRNIQSGEMYDFNNPAVKNELDTIKKHDFVSVAQYGGMREFIASYSIDGNTFDPGTEIPESFILKTKDGYQWTSKKPGQRYEASLRAKYNSEIKDYPKIPEKLQFRYYEEIFYVYGYIKGDVNDGERKLWFTDAINRKKYDVKIEGYFEKYFEEFCKTAEFQKALIRGINDSYSEFYKLYNSQTMGIFQYLYTEDGYACCLREDELDAFQIPLRYMPKEIVEGDRFYGFSAKDKDFEAVDPEGVLYAIWKVF